MAETKNFTKHVFYHTMQIKRQLRVW